jgi:DNA-binding transcriptional LysR family regulator
MVADGRISLALVEGDVAGEDLEILPFADDELILIAAPGHPLTGRQTVRAADLVNEPFVSREEGSGTRALFQRGLRAAGIEPRIVLALPTSEGIVRAVRRGLGFAMISRLVAADALERREVVRIAIRGVDLRRTFRLVRRRLRTPSPAARRFAELLFEGRVRAEAL